MNCFERKTYLFWHLAAPEVKRPFSSCDRCSHGALAKHLEHKANRSELLLVMPMYNTAGNPVQLHCCNRDHNGGSLTKIIHTKKWKLLATVFFAFTVLSLILVNKKHELWY